MDDEGTIARHEAREGGSLLLSRKAALLVGATDASLANGMDERR